MQCTKVGIRMSESLTINRSVVQGSGIESGMFVFVDDLKALGKDNGWIKFVVQIIAFTICYH